MLQRLALFNQEKDSAVTDRLTIDETTVLRLINEMLPSLSLDSKDVTPLLEEIVERSNLLLEVDNKTKYQFFHLTLQEFFAAKALADDSSKLLENFRANKDAWRETIKLWCGLPHNSTDLIKNIFKLDPLTAFECLADAPMVDQAMADTIIEHFKPLLGSYGGRSEAITKAFAGVAAGRSQRGRAALSFLMNALNTSKDVRVRKAAAEALALSNKEDAVICLSNRYDSDPAIVRPAITKMGNVAVTSLKRLAENGHLAAINALHAIGTTRGVNALIPLLWHRDERIQSIVALKLANIVSQKNGVELLREYEPNSQQKAQPWYDWVWAPFTDPSNISLTIIVGRIAYLLDTLGDQIQVESPMEADWRIVVPLALKERENAKVNLYAAYIALPKEKSIEALTKFKFSAEGTYFKDALLAKRAELFLGASTDLVSMSPFLQELGAPGKLCFLVGLMNLKTQLRFLFCLVNKTPPFLDRWQYIRRSQKPLRNFWPYTCLLLLVFVLSLAGLRELQILSQNVSLLTWKGVLYLYFLISTFGGLCLTGLGLKSDKSDKFSLENFTLALISFLYPLVLLVNVIRRTVETELGRTFKEHMQLFFSTGFPIVLTYFSTMYLLRHFSGRAVVIAWISIVVCALAVSWAIARHRSRFKNPLRQFALEQQQETA